ncbi:MAG: amidohydrolase [Methanobacteriota archaeon]|nr:MAG: amidohydrolase [Euryarchaeota archaeon]
MSEETILVKAKYIVQNTSSYPSVLKDGAILIQNGKIMKVASEQEFTDHADLVYDFPNHAVMPGIANAHSHAAMTLFRGYADDLPLQQWLNEYIWPIERKMTKDDVYLGAKLAAVEALMSGTTLFNSQYWHPEMEAKAFLEVGVRLVCGPPVLSGMAGLSFPQELISTYHGKNDDMTRISMNPHAPYTVSPEEYARINDFVENFNAKGNGPPMIVHTHVAEAKDEMDAIRGFAEKEGIVIPPDVSTPVEYLDKFDILRSFTLAAHAIEVPPKDQQTLAKHGVSVSVNTESNMKLANSVAPAQEYRQLGMSVGLGTDSACSNNSLDMFSTMKSTAIVQKGFHTVPTRLPASEIISMATSGGASAMGWKEVGDLLPGMYADLAVVDLNKPHLRPIPSGKTLLSHLVYAVKGSDVSDVMVGGVWKLRNRVPTGIDLPTLLEEFETTALNLLKA